MAAAFPPHADPNCPDPTLPEIPFSSIIPGDPLTPPEPIIEVDLFSFPLPIPETPLGCYCPVIQFTATQNPDPNGVTATAQSIPGINGCCEPMISLDLNLPADAFVSIPTLGCQSEFLGGLITRNPGEATVNVSETAPPGATTPPPFTGPTYQVSSASRGAATASEFPVDTTEATPNFFKDCELTFLGGAANASDGPRKIDEYFYDGLGWHMSFFPGNTWTTAPNVNDAFSIICGGTASPVGLCDTLVSLDLNIPCTPPRVGGSISRNNTPGLSLFVSETTPPGKTGPVAFTATVGATPTPAATGFGVSGTDITNNQIPQFFKGCEATWNGQTHIIEYYIQLTDGTWFLSFAAPDTWNPAPAAGNTITINCGTATAPVGPCETILSMDLNVPCTTTTLSTTVNEGSSPTATALIPSVITQNNCNLDLGLTLDLAVPFCGVITSSVATPGGAYDYNYTVAECATPATTFTASNCAETSYSANLDHGAVPLNTQVLVQLVSTNPSTYCFYFPMEPLDEPCSTVPAATITTNSMYRIRLWPYPAGKLKCITESASSSHIITCSDQYGIGWLPVSDPVVPVLTRPSGAKFWYNFGTHVEDYTLFTFLTMYNALFAGGFLRRSSIHLEVDGTVPPEQIVPGTLSTLLDEDPTVIYTGEGIWWMKDTWGNVPWADKLAQQQQGECISEGYPCPPQSYDRTYAFVSGYGYVSSYSPSTPAVPSGAFDRRLVLNLFYDEG